MIDRMSRTVNGNGFVIKAHLGAQLGWVAVSEIYATWEHAQGVLDLVPEHEIEVELQVFESLKRVLH